MAKKRKKSAILADAKKFARTIRKKFPRTCTRILPNGNSGFEGFVVVEVFLVERKFYNRFHDFVDKRLAVGDFVVCDYTAKQSIHPSIHPAVAPSLYETGFSEPSKGHFEYKKASAGWTITALMAPPLRGAKIRFNSHDFFKLHDEENGAGPVWFEFLRDCLKRGVKLMVYTESVFKGTVSKRFAQLLKLGLKCRVCPEGVSNHHVLVVEESRKKLPEGHPRNQLWEEGEHKRKSFQANDCMFTRSPRVAELRRANRILDVLHSHSKIHRP